MSNLGEVFRYRALALTLVGKELKTRYRGTILGFLWTFMNPLLMMLVYTLVFSVYMRTPVKNYAVFVFSGLLPWVWFSTGLLQASGVILRDGHLLKKVRFPAAILPLVAVTASGVNFLLSLPLYFVFALAFGVPLGAGLLALPLLMALQFMLLLGLGMLLAAVTVQFRDVEHLTGNLLTLAFFVTPILYPLTQVPERYRPLVLANPLAPLLLAYRDVLFYDRFPEWSHLVATALAAVVSLALGALVFSRLAPSFPERV